MRSKKMSPESAAQRGSERQDDRKITCHGQSRGPKSFCQVCSFIASQAATDRNPALTSDVLAEGLVQQSPRPELKGSGLELAVPLGHLEPPETKKSTCMESVGKTAETRMSVRNEVRKKNCQNGSSNLVIILAGRVCLHALKDPQVRCRGILLVLVAWAVHDIRGNQIFMRQVRKSSVVEKSGSG